MTDPCEILGVSTDVDEATLRQRYLTLVRQHPPEKSPRRFAEIREAYEQLRDPVIRLSNQILASRTTETLDDIIADVQARVRSVRIPTDTLLSIAER